MSTNEPIQIPIEGEATDFIADAKKVQAEMDALAAKLKEAGVSQSAYNKAVQEANKRSAAQAKAAEQAAAAQDKLQKETEQAAAAQAKSAAAVKQSSISITDLRSAYMMAADAVRIAGQVWQATGQEFVNYAEQVKNMSRSLGASAEETSRLIQVADDVRISYDTLKIAMKEAQKDGIDPNIEGLAKLADQYVKLQSPTEKTKFLLDKFGKSGMEMGKLMEKGGAGIKKMAGAIDDSLIMTKEGIKAADDYQASLDNMSDSAMAFQISIGKVVIGPVTNAMDNMVESLKVWKSNAEQAGIAWEHFASVNPKVAEGLEKTEKFLREISPGFIIYDTIFGKHTDSVDESTDALGDNSTAIDQNANALEEQKNAVKIAETALNDYKDMLKEVSQANQDAESFIQSYADFSKNYAEEHAAAVEQVRDAERELADATKEYGAESQQALDAAGNVEDARNGIQELEASWHEATNKMIYDMTLAKVSVDGLTDAEFAATQDLAVQMGIRTQAQADEAKAAMEKAAALAEGIAMQEDVQREKAETDAELLRLEEEKKAAAEGTTTAIVDGSAVSTEALGTVAQAVDSATQSYIAMAQAAWDAAAAAQSAAGSSSSTSGGTGGSSPDERGSSSSTTMDKSSTFNISIHNPVGDNSPNSIRRTLRLTSYLGLPA